MIAMNDLKQLERTISQQLSQELESLKKLQEDAARKRADEIDRLQREHKSELERYLLQQVAAEERKEEREKERRERFVRLAVYVILALLGSGGLGVSYVSDYLTRNDPREVVKESTDEVRGVLDERVEKLEERIEANDRKVERVVEVLLDQQVQLVEATDYLAEKLDAASPRARDVATPSVIQRARKTAAEIKAQPRAVTYNPADPLGDVE